jgi:hypothetical protein
MCSFQSVKHANNFVQYKKGNSVRELSVLTIIQSNVKVKYLMYAYI